MQSRGHRAFKNMSKASYGGDPSSLNQADLDELEVAQAHEYMMAKEERKKLINRDAKPKMNPLPRSPKCFGCLRYVNTEMLKLCGGCNIGTYVNTIDFIFFLATFYHFLLFRNLTFLSTTLSLFMIDHGKSISFLIQNLQNFNKISKYVRVLGLNIDKNRVFNRSIKKCFAHKRKFSYF